MDGHPREDGEGCGCTRWARARGGGTCRDISKCAFVTTRLALRRLQQQPSRMLVWPRAEPAAGGVEAKQAERPTRSFKFAQQPEALSRGADGSGCVVWGCSALLWLALGRLRTGSLAGRRVLELGSGCAVGAVAAVLAGAAAVTATDRGAYSKVAAANIHAACAHAAAAECPHSVAAFEWGGAAKCPAAGADLVLAADVLYHRDAHAPFLRAAAAALTAPHAVLLLAHKRRDAPSDAAFWRLLEAQQLRVALRIEGVDVVRGLPTAVVPLDARDPSLALFAVVRRQQPQQAAVSGKVAHQLVLAQLQQMAAPVNDEEGV